MRISASIKEDTYYPTIQPGVYSSYSADWSSDVVLTGSDSRSKTATPGFNLLKASGAILPVQPYSRTIVKSSQYVLLKGTGQATKSSFLSSKIVTVATKVVSVTPLVSSGSAALSYFAQDLNVLKEDSKAKLNDHISNVIVDLPTELGEAGQTARMVKNAVQRCIDYATGFKRLNQRLVRIASRNLSRPRVTHRFQAKSIKETAQDLNNMFLEFNYGWKPLYNTVNSSIELYKKQITEQPIRKKMSGKAELYKTVYSDWTTDNFNGNSTLPNVTYRIKHQCKLQVWHGGLMKDGVELLRQGLQTQLGLRFSNIVPSLWELTRFSFIADYFTNIGDVLGNLKFAPQKLHQASIYRSIKIDIETTIEIQGFTPKASDSVWVRTSSGQHTVTGDTTFTYFERIPLGVDGLIVAPIARFPSWDHVIKAASVAIAVSGLLKRK